MIYTKDKKIAIKAIEKSDLPLIQSWRNDESLRQYFREYRDFSITQKENWYDNMINDNRFEMFVIRDCDGNCLSDERNVGVTGITYIDWVNRHGDVHFYIGKNKYHQIQFLNKWLKHQNSFLFLILYIHLKLRI